MFPTESDKQLFSLAPNQQGVWIEQHLHPESPLYNMGAGFRIDGPVDHCCFERALHQVVRENDALRLAFVGDGSDVRQEVLSHVNFQVPLLDFSSEPEADARALAWIHEHMSKPMPLHPSPLFRFALIRTAPARYHWYQCYHHLIADGVTTTLIANRLDQIYTALINGQTPKFQPGPSYLDHILDGLAYRDSEAYQKHRDYWRSRLEHFPERVFTRGPAPSENGLNTRRSRLYVKRDHYDRLLEIGRDSGASMQHIFLAGLFHCFSGYEDRPPNAPLSIGLTLHNRRTRAFKQTMGMFAALTPFYFQLDPEKSVGAQLKDLAAMQQRDLRRGRFPAAAMLSSLDQDGASGLFDITLSFETRAYGEQLLGAPLTIHRVFHEAEVNPLVVFVLDYQAGHDVAVDFIWNRRYFPGPFQVAGLMERLELFLEYLARHPDAPLGRAPRMRPQTRREVLAVSRGPVAPLEGVTVLEFISRQAALNPRQPAMASPAMTYAQLEQRINGFAAYLIGKGLKPYTVVALDMSLSSAYDIAMLAVMRAGAVAAPLGPDWPADRRAFCITDAQARQVITDQLDLDYGVQAIRIIGKAPPVADAKHLPAPPAPLATAYIMYTSGSTGRPKGVMMSHAALASFVTAVRSGLDFPAGTRGLQLIAPGFDAGLMEFLGFLSLGVTVVPAPPEARLDPGRLASFIQKMNINAVFTVPSVLGQLMDVPRFQKVATLKFIGCGGEAMSSALRERLTDMHSAQLYNLYGPTETCIFSSWQACANVGRGQATPIGLPLANTSIYLLDQAGRLVHDGEIGEIHIGGPSLAQGYAWRPDQTAQVFVPDPFSSEPGARLYRTGDLGLRREDHALLYMGRRDVQIKLRGQRIEPGEIEAVLSAEPLVARAAVRAVDDRLVAYLVTRDRLDLDALRARLGARLTAAMVPTDFVLLSQMPYGPGGKINYGALPKLTAPVRQTRISANPTLELVRVIIARVLKQEEVAVDDDFFRMGGSSLDAMRVQSQIRDQFQIEVPIKILFQDATIGAIARAVEQTVRRGVGLSRVPFTPTGVAVPSFSQQRLWYLNRLNGPAYHVPFILHFQQRPDLTLLAAGLTSLCRRHEILRTRYPDQRGEPIPRVFQDPPVQFTPEVVEPAGREAAKSAFFSEPFILAVDAPIRYQAVVIDGHFELWVSIHHIAFDGPSMALFLTELFQPDAPEPALQYGDWAARQRAWMKGPVLERQLDYWRERLDGAATVLEMPLDFPRSETAPAADHEFVIPGASRDALRKTAAERGATPVIGLQTLFALLLSRYADQTDLLVGVPVTNRDRGELDGIIGCFLNTIAMRYDFTANPTFDQALRTARSMALSDFTHRDTPFEQVVDLPNLERRVGMTPVFQALFAFVDATPPQLPSGVTCETVPPTEAKFDLSLEMSDAGQFLRARLEYNAALFRAETIQRFARHFNNLLEHLTREPHTRIGDVVFMDRDEKELLLVTLNQTRVTGGARQPWFVQFETYAVRAPRAVALWYGSALEDSLSYGELNHRADQLAYRLHQLGVGPGDRIAVCRRRGPGMLIALLAVLKTGAAYVPLDPDHPVSRLRLILADATPRLILCDRDGPVPDDGPPLLFTDEDPNPIQPHHFHDRRVSLEHTAYVIYTSGSTGRPKGVAVSHGALANFLNATAFSPGLTDADTLLAVTTVAFDIAALELFLPLRCGGCVALADRILATDGQRLGEVLERPQFITVMQATPATWRLLVLSGFRPRLKMLCGGEALPGDLAATLLSWGGALWNLYGPTETTIWSALTQVTAESLQPFSAAPPIGRPIDNTRIYILDHRLQLMPPRTPGALYIAGRGLATGYLNRPKLTAEHFVPDPFATTPGERLYHTGDRARSAPDGQLIYLGRSDFQIKLRGFRIEPGEIEARLLALPQIDEALVTLTQSDDPALIAYVVMNDQPGEPPLEVLARQLPSYMTPSRLMVLDAFPLNPNGKINRAALPAPQRRMGHTAATPVAAMILDIFASVLDRDDLTVDDHFFRCGGHSLNAIRVLARIGEVLGVDLPPQALFQSPTAAGLAERLEKERFPGPQLPPPAPVKRRIGDRFPLTFGQERLWFLEVMAGAGGVHHVPAVLHFRGALNVPLLFQSLEQIVARHEILHAALMESEGVPYMTLVSPPVFDPTPVDIQPETRDALIRSWTAQPFAAGAPLIRARLVRLSPVDHQLIVVLHHMITDAWSAGVLLRELTAFYTADHQEHMEPLKPPALQFGDMAVWQRRRLAGEVLDEQVKWWTRYLSGAPHFIELPVDHPYPETSAQPGDSVSFQIDASQVMGLLTLAPTPAPALQALFAAMLARYADVDDVVMGTPFTNRETRAQESMIGFFLNTLPMRYRIEAATDLNHLMGQVRHNVLDAYSRRSLPFEKLVEAVQPERRGERHPLFQVTTTHQDEPDPVLNWPGLERISFETPRQFSRYELSLYTRRVEDVIYGELEYRTDLFDRQTVASLVTHFQTFLTKALLAPRLPLRRIDFLGEAERLDLLRSWNRTQEAAPHPATWVEVFYQHAAAQPDRPAFYHGPKGASMLTYGQLARRADDLAAHLRRRGLRPGGVVAVYHHRTADLVISLTACARLGCMAVPLDPGHPAKRNALILADARPDAILADRECDPPHGSGMLVRPTDAPPAPGQTFAGLFRELPAYTIYTSGSTGRPKGVTITHGALVHFLAATAVQPGMNAKDHLAAVTTAAFDISGLEIYLPLFTGARFTLFPASTASDPHLLGAALDRGAFTMMQATPATWTMLIAAGFAPNLKMLSGGEALSPGLAAALLQPGRELWNLYGPTETTIWSACTRVTKASLASERGVVQLGRPIAATSLYVLDRSLEPLPVGVTGDLYIGGAGLALGYRHRGNLTADAFVPNPFSRHGGERLYRTGDRARFSRDGRLEYMGRCDFQIKLRGFRIETGEIESALRDHPHIDNAAVVLRRVGEQDALTAYLVHETNLTEPLHPRDFLTKLLPGYMIPAFYVSLPELPLNPNGKLDRAALPAPELEPEGDTSQTPAEALMAAIWADVLGIAPPARHRDFFDLGGQSLAAARVAARVRTGFGVDMSVRDLFEAPTPAQLCRLLESRGRLDEEFPLTRVEGLDAYPLSDAQSRIWLDDQLTGGNGAYHLARAWDLTPKISKSRLRRALTRLLDRHEILRTRIVNTDEGPRAVHGDTPKTLLPIMEVGQHRHLDQLIQQEINRPFQLDREPPVRAVLFHPGGTAYRFLLVVHHIAADGWSADLILRDLARLYDADADDAEAPAFRYVDFALHHRNLWAKRRLSRRLEQRRDALALAPPLQLPTDVQAPPGSAQGAVHTFPLDPDLAAAVREQARVLDCTVSMFFTAVYAAFLARISGQDALVIGLPSANRDLAASESVVGCFINNLPLLLKPAPLLAFDRWVTEVRRETLAVYMDRGAPFETLVTRADTPLIETLFQMTPRTDPLRLADEVLLEQTPPVNRVKMALAMEMMETEVGFTAAFFYRTDLFKPETIARASTWYMNLLSQVVAAPTTPLGQLQLADPGALLRRLADWNAVSAPIRGNPVQWILSHAVATPGAVAVSCGDQFMTYAQLCRRMDRIALRLPPLEPGKLIGVCLPRDLDLLPALTAVWRAGHAFVPLDPALPAGRLTALCGDVDLLITRTHLLQSAFGDQAPLPPSRVLCLDQTGPLNHDVGLMTPMPEALAYVMYTSGSTGRPKGVMITHRALSDYLNRAAACYNMTRGSGAPVIGSIGFDATLTSLLTPLVTGKTVSLILENDPEVLGRRIFRFNDYSMIKLTPAHLDLLARLRGDGLRLNTPVMVLGGEALHPDRLAPWLRANPKITIYNEYGPTEATVGATVARVIPGQPISIGRPFANTRVYIVDQLLNPLPVGIVGELLIGGAGLAVGYLNRAAETAARFIPDSLGGKPGERLYRTGDLARFDPDGNLIFMGRVDQQVKIRGYRVEPAEVEAALLCLPGIHEALVSPRTKGGAEPRLIAWVIGQGDLDPTRIRGLLSHDLPEYMTPEAVVVLDAFPLTANGKINHAALPDPDDMDPDGGRPCKTATERLLAEIFSAVLNRTIVHADADFRGLGGNSLAAARIVAAVRDRLGVDLNLRDVFSHVTPAALARLVDAAQTTALPLKSTDRRNAPLSFPQLRLWLLDLFQGSSAYHVHHVVKLSGHLNVDALRAAFNDMVRRHHVLHTRFLETDKGPVPRRVSAGDIRINAVAIEDPEMLRQTLAAHRDQPFDLANDPLMRVLLVRLAPQRHVLALTLHHMVSDGWSMGILAEELSLLYPVFAAGGDSPLTEPVIQYADFAAWQQARLERGELDAQIHWWRERLAGAPTRLELFHQPHAQVETYHPVGAYPMVIKAETVTRVTGLAESINGTPFMVLLAAYGLLLARYADVNDLLIGIPEANRTHAALESLIGFFVNTLPVRCRPAQPTVNDYLADVRDGLLGDLAHRDVPFERLVELKEAQRDSGFHPLIQVMFSFWDRPAAQPELPGLKVEVLETQPAAAKFDLLLDLNVDGDQWRGRWEYDTSRFHHDAVVAMNTHFANLLTAMLEHRQDPPMTLNMLGADERRRLLQCWSRSAVGVEEPGVAQVISVRMRTQGSQTALMWADQEMTFAQLAQESGALAAELIRLGVGPERVVGLCMNRGPNLIIGLTAVLQAGAAWLPLDPAQPEWRLHYMVQDAGAQLILTENDAAHLAPKHVPVLNLELFKGGPAGPATPVQVMPEHAAYIIYTSGSTGTPKGVMMTQGALANHMYWMLNTFPMSGRDRVLHKTPIGFDASIWELLAPLMAGAVLVLAPIGAHQDATVLAQTIVAFRVTRLQLVPTLAAHLLAEPAFREARSLTHLFCGGEALSPDLRNRCRELLDLELINLYGPTETCIDTTFHRCVEAKGDVPIGRPIAGDQVYILDPAMEPTPTGVVGELYVAGMGVARGYRNRPDLTAWRFIPNPFAQTPGDRLYRTGDRVRGGWDGAVHFEGRADFQIKLRGRRMEPAEIEAALMAHPAVLIAAVAAIEEQLVGFIQLVTGDQSLDENGLAADLRRRLRSRLPEAMIPTRYVVLEAMPLNASGKVNRNALPRAGRQEARPHVAPRTDLERGLARIWGEVLDREGIGVEDGFFEIGGHSLPAVRILTRLRKAYGVDLSLRAFFDAPTIAALATLVEAAKSGGESGPGEDEEDFVF